MIQLTPLPAMPHGPIRPALLASVDGSSFARALGALAVPQAALPELPDGEALLPGRQMPATTGKDLPEPAEDADSDDDAEAQDAPEDGTNIAFVWFAAAPAPTPTPTPGFAPVALASANTTTQAPREVAALPDLLAAAPQPETAAETPVARQAPEIAVADAPAPSLARTIALPEAQAAPTVDILDAATPKAVPPATPVATSARLIMPSEPGDRPARPVEAPAPSAGRSSPPLEGPQTAQPLPATALAVPPSVPFGPVLAALAAAVPAAPLPLRRALAIDPSGLAIPPAVPDAMPPHAVPATPDTQHEALDTRRQQWMGKMVETIEAMRDAAPVRETRLSLMPEALGKVDVSIRHDGDRVHVHFATETPAARQLIAEAQPRLSELAEARGLKLGQTSFDSGSAGQGENRDTRHNPAAQPSAPRRAPSDSTVAAAADDRIA